MSKPLSTRASAVAAVAKLCYRLQDGRHDHAASVLTALAAALIDHEDAELADQLREWSADAGIRRRLREAFGNEIVLEVRS